MSGPGGALAITYAILALAAGARSAVQIATRFADAPGPYLLSAAAAIVYLVIALTVAKPGARPRRIAAAACALELMGVLAVGFVSLLDPGAFADQTVWWRFGQGYGYLPLALPVLGLIWLRRSRGVP